MAISCSLSVRRVGGVSKNSQKIIFLERSNSTCIFVNVFAEQDSKELVVPDCNTLFLVSLFGLEVDGIKRGIVSVMKKIIKNYNFISFVYLDISLNK